MHERVAFSVDLNASPLPETEDEKSRKVHYAQQEHVESAVEIMRRERGERRRRLKRKQQNEGSKLHSQQMRTDYVPQRKTSRHGNVKDAPQGWLECPAFGEPIINFTPSKVPLDETFNESVPPGKRYSFKQVLNKQRNAGHDIGLVIDLTNTTRYYSSGELTKRGIKHMKIPCKGRDAVPDNESVNTFVHKAIHIFSQRRPPGIYKRDSIEALYSFYHEVPEITCPSTSEWKKPDDLNLNGEAKQDDDDDNIDLAPPHQDSDDKAVTNDDVLEDAIPYDQEQLLRVKCYQLLEMPFGKGNSLFPGSHPVSLNSDNLQLLWQRYYYATWKADGTRYMMLIQRDGCFLIDRNFRFRRVQMRFPRRKLSEVPFSEMVVDVIPDSKPKSKRRYLAYDLMALNSMPKTKSPFSERWEILQKEIIEPRCYEKQQFESGAKSNPSYEYDKELFSVRRKDFWVLSTAKNTLEKLIPKLCHASDGLIFQGWDDPYVPLTHEGLLKWKYPEMDSVDFLFEVGSDNNQLMFLYERGKRKLLDGAQITFPGEIDPSSVTGRIVECSWNKEERHWVCMRIRSDKSTPNDINTYRKVLRSITDNITQEKLLHEVDEITRLPMYANRIARDLEKIAREDQRRRK